MTELYKFDNLYLEGGYNNIYSFLEKSVDQDKKKEIYDASKREKDCKKDDKPKMSCESGKLLKYLIRMELISYENAKKNAKKTKEEVKKSDYLKIVKNINDKKYKINVFYIRNFFNEIQKNLKKMADNLENCEYLVNVDMDSVAKSLHSSIISDDQKKKEKRRKKGKSTKK